MEKYGHCFKQGGPDESARIVHDGEKVACRDVPNGGMNPSCRSGPWHVDLVLDTTWCSWPTFPRMIK